MNLTNAVSDQVHGVSQGRVDYPLLPPAVARTARNNPTTPKTPNVAVTVILFSFTFIFTVGNIIYLVVTKSDNVNNQSLDFNEGNGFTSSFVAVNAMKIDNQLKQIVQTFDTQDSTSTAAYNKRDIKLLFDEFLMVAKEFPNITVHYLIERLKSLVPSKESALFKPLNELIKVIEQAALNANKSVAPTSKEARKQLIRFVRRVYRAIKNLNDKNFIFALEALKRTAFNLGLYQTILESPQFFETVRLFAQMKLALNAYEKNPVRILTYFISSCNDLTQTTAVKKLKNSGYRCLEKINKRNAVEQQRGVEKFLDAVLTVLTQCIKDSHPLRSVDLQNIRQSALLCASPNKVETNKIVSQHKVSFSFKSQPSSKGNMNSLRRPR